MFIIKNGASIISVRRIFMNSVFKRVSIRDYLDKPVEQNKIDLILKAGMQAPSAKNEQPWEFYIVTNKKALEALSNTSDYSTCILKAPICIVPCMKKDNPCHEYAIQDMSASVENILLEITELNLGGVYMGVYPSVKRVDYVRKTLEVPEELIPFCLIPVGYPKQTREQVSRYDEKKVHIID